MTANLTRNSSKTEFLLIGLSKQLAKINNSLNTTHSARNLGFIFDEHFTFSDQISSVSISVSFSLHIRQLRCIRPYLDNNSCHHRHFHCSLQAWLLQLCLNLPKFHITRLQQIQNSLARAVVKAPKSSHITPILRSLHWLKITERIEYKLLSPTKFSQPPSLHVCITSSQFSLLAALALHLWSHSLVHPHHLVNRSFLPVCFPSSLESTPGFPPSTTH